MVERGSDPVRVSGMTETDAGGLTLSRRPSSFPPAVENLHCMGSQEAYVVQRGSLGQIIRKEVRAHGMLGASGGVTNHRSG